MTKFGTKIIFFTIPFYFLHRPQEKFVFHETVHEHIEYGDIHANIFLCIFDFFMKGAYAPGIKSAFPAL
jgi:hypothetical protein